MATKHRYAAYLIAGSPPVKSPNPLTSGHSDVSSASGVVDLPVELPIDGFCYIEHVRLIDFAVAALRRIANNTRENIEFNIFIVIPNICIDSTDPRVYYEWATTRCIPIKNLLFMPPSLDLQDILQNHILLRAHVEAKAEMISGIILINPMDIQNERFNISVADAILTSQRNAVGTALTVKLDTTSETAISSQPRVALLVLPVSTLPNFTTLCGTAAPASDITSMKYMGTIPDFFDYVCTEMQLSVISSNETAVDYSARTILPCTTMQTDELHHMPKMVSTTCPARIGFLGNPSDGFLGQTISFLMSNYGASICIEERDSSHQTNMVEIVPHPVHDMIGFEGLDGLHISTENKVDRFYIILERY
jgi:hypothetical protein